MNSTKHIAQIVLPGIDTQATDSTENGTGTNSDYLNQLKAKTDKIAETLVDTGKYEYGIEESYRLRLDAARQAKAKFGDDTIPTKKELDYCFPGCEHPEQRQERPEQQKPDPTHPLSHNQAEQRLGSAGNPNLTDKDWEQIEKMNGTLHVGLHYAAGFTPEFLVLDIKLKLTSDFGRLYQFITIYCNRGDKDNLHAESKGVSVKKLAEKLETSVPQMWRTVKKMHESPIATANPLPKKADETFIFDLHCVTEMNELVKDRKRIEVKTGMTAKELWKNRELLGFSLYRSGGETEGEAEGEGVSPPSS